MTPSIPIDLPAGTAMIEVADPLDCGMLRFGLPCGNSAFHVFVCPMSHDRYRLIPVCVMCMNDADDSAYNATGKSWIQLLEIATEKSTS